MSSAIIDDSALGHGGDLRVHGTGSINRFLRDARDRYSPDAATTVVMGNEAADLDSMASAVTFAYFLSRTGTPSVPLMNIPRADFDLRAEAVFLFGQAGVDPDLLLFREDIDLDSLNRRRSLELVLVDHNRLATSQAGLQDSVIRVLDHHADEKQYPGDCDVDIRPVGSTATMVSQCFLRGGRELIDSTIGTLLLGTILLDTANLDAAAGRFSPQDVEAADALLAMTGIVRSDLFDKLQFERYNVSSLGTYDLLRKDYKEWQFGSVRCGISSVRISVTAWVERDPGILAAFGAYMKERKLDVLISMNAYMDQGFARDLVVCAADRKIRAAVLSFLESGDLGLERIDVATLENDDKAAFFNQRNRRMSRKKLQPLLSAFFGTDR